MKLFDRFLEGLKETRAAFGDEEVMSISRRYFIGNGFDGTMTSIGIAVSSYLSGVPDGSTVLMIVAGAAVGLGTSGIWSVWEIERAEKQAEVARIEGKMLEPLGETEVYERKQAGRRVNALMSGLGPTLGIFLPAIPFAFEELYLTMFQAAAASVVIATTLLFLFGVYMGRISKQKWYEAGVRMGLAGVVVTVINLLLPGGAQ